MFREVYLHMIEKQFRVHPICALLGPRQVGKTTLAHMFVEKYSSKRVEIFDLENPIDLARLENPQLAMHNLEDILIVIDEIQRRPDLFPILRVLADEKHKKRKFLILGSASRDLLQQSSESLAGRIGYIEVTPFALDEVHDIDKLWVRGGFPLAYLAETEEDSALWRQAYITTFLDRDIPALGFLIPSQQVRRFWLMLAQYHGQIFNGSELGRSLGTSHHTIKKYLDILAGTFMIRLLPPWHENLAKRQVKSPKIYFRDSGILNTLLGINSKSQLHNYPKMGAFWEGFALEEIIRQQGAAPEECFFWGTQGGAKLDLLIIKNGRRLGFEFKFADAPKKTVSMAIALEDLKLDHLNVVYPGKINYALDKQITVLGLNKF